MNAPNFQIRPGAWVAAFNKHYPAFLSFLYGLGVVITTLMLTLVISLLIPGLMFLLLFVEHERVKHGILLFEPSRRLADLAAWALIISSVCVKFLVYYVENEAGYQAPPRFSFSVRLFARNLGYRLGLTSNWQPRPLSPAHEQRNVLRLVSASILILALAGSMSGAMEQQAGVAWYEALVNIVTSSELLEMATWSGGWLYTVTAVLLSQVVMGYIAYRASAAFSQMLAQDTSTPAQPDAPPAPADEDTQPTPAIQDELEAVGSQDFLSSAPASAANSTTRKASGRGREKPAPRNQ